MKVLEVRALEAVQPGMKVAAAVVDDGGRVLVPVGAEVTEAMLAGLARREIVSIKVELEVEEDPAAREAHRAVIVSRLDRIFRKAGDAAETRTLYQAVLTHRMENPQ
jgi:hypothetical protein